MPAAMNTHASIETGRHSRPYSAHRYKLQRGQIKRIQVTKACSATLSNSTSPNASSSLLWISGPLATYKVHTKRNPSELTAEDCLREIVASACARFLGKSAEDIIGKDNTQLVPPKTARCWNR